MKKTIGLGMLFVASSFALAAYASQVSEAPYQVAEADTMEAETMEAETMETSAASGPHELKGVDAALHIPDVDYRRDWTVLGSYSVLADEPEDGAKELHVVYAEPQYVDAFRKNGVFPDGAVLIKDVFAAKTEFLTTGTASYANELAGRFIMIKDGDNANAGKSPLWGDGWGWAFYEGDERTKSVTVDYKQDCLTCHEPARATDLIFTQGYPVLKR